MSKLYVITGPAGVGKSTVTNALADRLSKCAVLEGDEIYHQVKSGCVKPWLEGNHVDLMWKNMVMLSQNYLESGFDVVLNYIIYNDDFEFIKESIKGFEIHFIVLMAERDTVAKRDTERGEEFAVNRVDKHIAGFLKQGYDEKHYLYNDNKTIEEEVDEILTGKFKV